MVAGGKASSEGGRGGGKGTAQGQGGKRHGVSGTPASGASTRTGQGTGCQSTSGAAPGGWEAYRGGEVRRMRGAVAVLGKQGGPRELGRSEGVDVGKDGQPVRMSKGAGT